MIQILLVEDEDSLRYMMSQYLVNHGFNVTEAKNGEQALLLMEKNKCDLIITDIMMPILDGYEFTEGVRIFDKTIPILMITAKETIDDKEKGFTVGGDDYMVKPIILKEMLFRVNALLKRSNINSTKIIKIDEFVLNQSTFTTTFKSQDIQFSKKEFLLLFKLLSNPNRIFTKNQLMDDIWGYESISDEATVKVHISRIRDKLKDVNVFKIVTIKGLGYKGVI